ncbi:hypothetical protein VTO42DRAFT_2737 [Malbranchea cinnamomea]
MPSVRCRCRATTPFDDCLFLATLCKAGGWGGADGPCMVLGPTPPELRKSVRVRVLTSLSLPLSYGASRTVTIQGPSQAQVGLPEVPAARVPMRAGPVAESCPVSNHYSYYSTTIHVLQHMCIVYLAGGKCLFRSFCLHSDPACHRSRREFTDVSRPEEGRGEKEGKKEGREQKQDTKVQCPPKNGSGRLFC